MKPILIHILLIAIIFTSCKKEFSSSISPYSIELPYTERVTQNIGTDTSLLRVYILAGQSNELGGDPNTSATPAYLRNAIPGAYIIWKPLNSSAKNAQVQVLKYGVNNYYTKPTVYFGPECSLAYAMTKAGKKIGIIKYAGSGSALVDIGYWANGNWQTEAIAADGLRHFPALVGNWAMQGLDAFRAAGFKPYIAGFCWTQGETDTGDSLRAYNYEHELIKLIDKFKDTMRTKDPAVDSMHIVITRIHNHFNAGTRPYLNTVRTAQVNVANHYGTKGHWIDSDSFPVIADHTHWTRTGQDMHGKAIANILLQIIH